MIFGSLREKVCADNFFENFKLKKEITMPKPEIFYQLFSPPARTAYFVAKEIGLNFVER